MMADNADLIRMKQEYADRKTRLDKTNLYSRYNPAYLYAIQHRERDLLKRLKKNLEGDFSQKTILEIGCGSGGVLLEYLVIGANSNHLFGLDILFDRLNEAQSKIPEASILNANGEYIPFKTSSFDLVIQYTAFSSVLNDALKKSMAQEMLRVLAPGGLIIWYDFWLNPTNNQTKGIKPPEIRRLFPNCHFDFHKITLAPPLARKIVPFSWMLAEFLESLKFLNSHYLVIIRKE